MSANTYHSISSSDEDDEVEDYKSIEIVEDKSPDGAVKLKTMNDILSKVKGVKYDFGYITNFSNAALYSNEITEDDEIWFIQTPRDVNTGSIKESNLKFEDFSQTAVKGRRRERHFTAHAIKSTDEEVNLTLPSQKTQSFHMSKYPVMGRIILQEDLQVDNKNETLCNITNSSSIISESNNNFADSQTTKADSTTPLKKKRKSIKQDFVQN